MHVRQIGTDQSIDELVQRVRSEYLEMPGLRLTFAQATRFLSLDRTTCTKLLDVLVKTRVLAVAADGRYVRAGSDG